MNAARTAYQPQAHHHQTARGDRVMVKGLGERVVRQARKAGRCREWLYRLPPHQINVGDLYVETEPNSEAGGFGWDRCCLRCAGVQQREVQP